MRHLSALWLSISVSILLGISAAAQAATAVKLDWTIPTTRENGQALAIGELTGYELYYTTDNSAVTGTIKVSGGSTSSYTVQNLAAGTYHFAMSAIDVGGVKSKLSTIADITLVASTAAPMMSSYPTVSTTVVAGVKKITVNWSIPTTRTDGTPLSVTELSGYKINVREFWTRALVFNASISGGSVTSYAISTIPAGFYIVELVAVDKAGKQSANMCAFINV